MNASGGNAVPIDRRELLAAADPCARALVALVRRLVDELEEAAPWRLLLAEPPELADLEQRVMRLLEIIEQTPGRIAAALGSLPGAPIADSVREEAEFYFAALHQMTAADRRLLRAALDRTPPPATLSEAAGAYLAEVAADLKGKYASAMMGAAAALVSDGRSLGVDVEASLFPEKAEEQTRNRTFLSALAEADSARARLRLDFPWRSIFQRWSAGRPVERGALQELAELRPAILALLTSANRRALYSGDFHLLQRRERLLECRWRELEQLHLASRELAAESPSTAAAALYARLCQLTLELAAVLDAEVLRGLIGDKALLRLHQMGAHAKAARSQPEPPDVLAQLLAEEDLSMFIRLLFGEVTKRSSIARESGVMPLAPAGAPAGASAAAPGAAPGALRAAPRPARRDESETRQLEAALAEVLSRLTSADHHPWRAFQMVHKLHSRLRVLPPTLLAEIQPFLAVLRSDLLPLVEAASTARVLPAATSQTLRAAHRRLSELDFSLPEHQREMGTDLGRVVRLLSSLAVAVNAGSG